MMYVFNVFPMFKRCPETMQKMLSVIEKDSPKLDQDKEFTEEEAEDYCLSLLLQAVCNKTLGDTEKAESLLQELLQFESHLAEDIYLATYAMAEMGYMAMDKGQYEEALQWLDRSCHAHTDYHLESFLHYRIHAAIRHIQTLSSIMEQVSITNSIPKQQENGLYPNCSMSPPTKSPSISIYESPVPPSVTT
ncbi:tetratricopeptide repeat protein 39B [Nephila pilipes]|uniref:Tetratricopeptide repeat protein 39B n=1 Tax=Nephila pilipes TaxID=299642 RepID=A0A8X6Q8W8_NEPPI|nr:tetratricopeptide repeat protein 39B [Nephila pilipes]